MRCRRANACKLAKWSRDTYSHVCRTSLAVESLRTGLLLHRFDGQGFIPVISHASMSDVTKQAAGRDCIQRLSPTIVASTEVELRKKWTDIAKLVVYTARPLEDVFQAFLEAEYVPKLASKVDQASGFQPAYHVSLGGVSEDVVSKRRKVSESAIVADGEAVEEAIAKGWEKLPPDMKPYTKAVLPEDAKQRPNVSQYYNVLTHIVQRREADQVRNQPGVTPKVDPAVGGSETVAAMRQVVLRRMDDIKLKRVEAHPCTLR